MRKSRHLGSLLVVSLNLAFRAIRSSTSRLPRAPGSRSRQGFYTRSEGAREKEREGGGERRRGGGQIRKKSSDDLRYVESTRRATRWPPVVDLKLREEEKHRDTEEDTSE